MNIAVKHSIIFFSGLLLVVGTLFVSSGSVKNAEEMKQVGFGYPFNFVTKDFSQQQGFQFFPRYFNLDYKNLHLENFLFPNFILSLLSVFIFLEIIVYLLERIKYFALLKLSAKKSNGFFPEKNNTAGFTIIEILVIVAITAILAGIILWNINVAREKSRANATLKSMSSIITSATACLIDDALPETTRRIGPNSELFRSVCVYHNGTNWMNAFGYGDWPQLSSGWVLPSANSGLYCSINSTNGNSCGAYNNGICGGDNQSGKFCFRAEHATDDTKFIWCTQLGCKTSGF